METLQSGTAPVQEQNVSESFNIREILSKCLARWYWFVISVAICLFFAVRHTLKTQPVYTRSSVLVIKADQRGRSIGGVQDSFADLGFFHTSSKTVNEIKAFQSVSNMREVVERLHLNMNYSYEGRFHKVVLYGPSLPFTVSTVDVSDNTGFEFDMDISTLPEAVVLRNFRDPSGKKIKGYSCEAALGDTVETRVGKLVVTPSAGFNPESPIPYSVMHVARRSVKGTGDAYAHRLSVTLEDKMSDVIRLTFNDVNIARAEDVLSTTIAVYNEHWISDKNQISMSTSLFIGDRLKVIEKELSGVEQNISQYKSQNLLPDLAATASMDLSNSNALSIQIQQLSNQLYMTKHISNYISSSSNKYQLIPANSGIENGDVANQISKYNEMLLQYNSIVANSSTSNPLAQDMDAQLMSMRDAIEQSLSNHIMSLNTQISSLEKRLAQTDSRLAKNPTQARYLLSEERQQAVKESIYLYLLQKREENELSQAFTAYNTRILDPPTGPNRPISPKKKQILLIAFMLGLLIPAGIIYLQEVLNTKIRGKSDLKSVTVPFLGEIPLAVSSRSERRATQKDTGRVHKLVVEQGNRNAINEAFRVLRTNIEFMSRDRSSNVILVTSFNPSSGKSFIAVNTAVSLAIKGQKVLVIDGDLRNASTSQFVNSPDRGLSNYLSGQVDDVDALVVRATGYDSLDVLPVGTIPPNPSELVSDPRLAECIDRMRGRYDYIFIDCPPVDIVADTQIIEKLVDRTIFVVRVGLLERAMVPELEAIYKQQRFKNLSLVLNGTVSAGHYGSRYGYHYGYGSRRGYGYGSKSAYGYGYGSSSSSSSSGSDRGWRFRLPKGGGKRQG